MPVKNENVPGRECRNHFGEKRCQQGRKDPVRETAQTLPFGTMTVGKDFGNENPNDRAFADGMSGDEGKNASRNDRIKQ